MLPQIDTAAVDPPRNSSRTAKKSRAHVLVVDDDRLLRWAVAETLGDRGYDVSEAADAKSALQALATRGAATDLVLLDLFLPDVSDLRVLNLIRTSAPAIPVVLMTSFVSPEIVEQAMAAGARVITKPFDMDTLTALIERTLAARLS